MAALLRSLGDARRRGRVAAGSGAAAEQLHRVIGTFGPAGEQADQAAASTSTGLVEPLTDRELEVLRLLAAGRRNRDIAQELVVTLETVKKHTSHLLDKLGAANRTEAVAHARRLGLLPETRPRLGDHFGRPPCRRLHRVFHLRVMSRCGPVHTVGPHASADPTEETEMLAGDWTGLLASQRMTDLHREAERQRLVRLAKAERRGGRRRLAWSIGWHGQVGVIQAARVWLQPRLRWRRAGLRQGGERA